MVGKTLCLNMIVKNEMSNLERCLQSVAPYISSWMICDTGSTDGTQSFIREFFAERSIAGELLSFPFIDFAQARNAALDHAYGRHLKYDYILLADADMELVVEEQHFRTKLEAASYRMIQRTGDGLTYWNTRLVRWDAGARYRGVTHEYIDVSGDAASLHGIWYKDHASGANRADKFERDIRLLENGLEADPGNSRYWYYLAQSYRDAGRPAEAAKAYAKRAEMGGWEEEAWSARLQLARCYLQAGNESEFVRQAVAAFDQRPRRAEPLYDLARFYRERGMNEASLVFSERGLSITPPEDDVLFVEEFVYTTSLKEEFSIAANYSRDPLIKERGFATCNWLALNIGTPERTRNLARSNLYFYVEPAARRMPSFRAHRVEFTPIDGYRATNPSVTRLGDKIVVVQRTVNYVTSEDGKYDVAGNAPIQTRNFLLLLDDSLALQSTSEILPPTDLPEPAFAKVRGFEDVRPFQWQGALWCVACVREFTPEGICEQVLARIERGTSGSHVLTDWRVLRYEGPRRHEKNWMPQVVGDTLQFVYACAPTRLVGCAAQTIGEMPCPIVADNFFGGSQTIDFEGGRLALIHEQRMKLPSGSFYYLHRFVWFDGGGKLKGVSRPFFFNAKGIEFAAGLAWHPDGKRLLLSYGVRDEESWIASVEAADVRHALEDSECLPWAAPKPSDPISNTSALVHPALDVDRAWRETIRKSHDFRNRGDESGFRQAALAALALRPDRAEPLRDLARYCLSRSRWDEACLHAEAGMALSPQAVHLSNPAWSAIEIDLREAFSIAANHSTDRQRKEKGHSICDWLATSRNVPASVRGLARYNLCWYAEPAQILMKSLEFRPVSIAAPDGFTVGNISIVQTGAGFLVAARAINYKLLDNGEYDLRGDRSFKSRVLLATLDDAFEVTEVLAVAEPVNMPPAENDKFLGFEDPRLFLWRGELWCVCSVCQFNVDGVAEMVLARIDRNDDGRASFADWKVLPSGTPNQWQKNWMPQIADGELRLIYSLDPTCIVNPAGAVTLRENPEIAAENFKGGSQAIPFDGGWLMVVHEWELANARRRYLHRLVWLDGKCRLRRHSRRFFFRSPEVEFAAGLAWHPDGRRLVISFSVNDCVPLLAIVDAEDCRTALVDVHVREEALNIIDAKQAPPTGNGHEDEHRNAVDSGANPIDVRATFLSLAPFLQAIDSPGERRKLSREFDARIAPFLGKSGSTELPQIHCYYEVLSDTAAHTTIIAATRSMRAVGHPVKVWSYSLAKLDFLAASGVELRDAAEIVPKLLFERIVARTEIRYFSDIFRYAVLYEHGGLWMDADVVMVRAFPFRGDHFFNLQWWHSEEEHFVCGNVIYAERHSRHMRGLYKRALDGFLVGAGVHFGDVGPKLLSEYIASEEGSALQARLFSPMFFNSIDWTEVDRFNEPVGRLRDYLNDDRVTGIHLWNARTQSISRDGNSSLLSMLSNPDEGMPRLTVLAEHFDTDKNSRSGNRHCYARVYEQILGPRKFALRRLMEIGLCRGLAEGNQTEAPSVALWQSYFPFCHVFGVDLTDFSQLNNDRFTSFVCDQSKREDLRRLASNLERGSFDVIIDDGSHASLDQQLTLIELFPLLADGGWYFIEDLDWQPPGEDREGVALTKALLGHVDASGAPILPDPLGIGALAEEFAEIKFFDSHYELERAGLMGGLVAIRKGGTREA